MSAPKGIFPGESDSNIKPNTQRFKATGEFRSPRKGEFFLSGAIVQAYKAHNDLEAQYWIAKPVVTKTCTCCNGTGIIEE